MAENDQAAPVRMKPWLRVLLAVSLALNLIVVGLVGGALVMRERWHAHHPPQATRIIGPLTRALEPADKRAIGREIRAAYHARSDRARPTADLEGLLADLRRDPFEAEAVAAHLRMQRARLSDRLELGQRLLLERLEQMSAAERAAYADRVAEAARDARSWRRRAAPE
jgi:hypothetical protein